MHGALNAIEFDALSSLTLDGPVFVAPRIPIALPAFTTTTVGATFEIRAIGNAIADPVDTSLA